MPTEDGWEPYRVTEDQLEWTDIPGAPVRLQFLKGLPLQILRAVAADFHAYVEPLRDEDSAAATPYGNSVETSNHWNGTAMDLNWDSHPFHVRGTFTPAQMVTIREIIEFYEGNVFWAGDWDDPIDEMHWQMGYNTYNNQAKLRDFVARKITADGFSTFRRGAVTPPPPTPAPVDPPAPKTRTAADVLYDAVPVIDEARAAELAPLIGVGLIASDCTNPRRIAMWLAQPGHESDGFETTEEYESGDESTDRWRYKGRTWIQITWQSNYAAFSKWCFDRGLVPDPAYFVNHPKELADLKWAALGPAWYWTVARPGINAMCDAADMTGVTKAINGGTNGIADRRARYAQAIALGDELMLLVSDTETGKGALMALSDAEQSELLTKVREIWDQLRGPGGNGWPQLGGLTPVDALAAISHKLKDAAVAPSVDDIHAALQGAFTKLGTPTAATLAADKTKKAK